MTDEVIVLDHVHKQIGRQLILEDVSFSVARGDIFGYLGPNGAGKTTTMRIALGLIRPTSGTALVCGKNLGQEVETRSKVGVLLERDGIYDRLSAKENLTYYACLYGMNGFEPKIDRLLETTGLSGREHDKAGTFSKGMKRKLALVRAIMTSPEVLFLDEPSAGLDPEAQKMVRDLLVQLTQENKMTIFLNSHDLDEVQRICTKIAVIQSGKIIVCSKIENLTATANTSIVNLKLADVYQRTRAYELLKTTNFVAAITQKGPAEVQVTLQNNGKPSDLLELLVSHGIKVDEVKAVTESLEDIYLDIVHQENRDV